MESYKFTLFSDCLKKFDDARNQLHDNIHKALVETKAESSNAEHVAEIERAVEKAWNGDAAEKLNVANIIEIISDSDEDEDAPLAQRLKEVNSYDQKRSNSRRTRSQQRRGRERGRGGRGKRSRRRTNQSSDMGEPSEKIIVIDDEEGSEVGHINETIYITDDEEIIVVGNKQDVEMNKSFSDIPGLEKAVEEVQENDKELLNYSEINVKIYWRGRKVIRIPLRRYQKFGAVFKHLADTENVDEEKIVLFLHDEKIIRPDDSPDSLKLTIADVIDGGIVSSQVANNDPRPREPVVDKDDLQFKLLFKDRKKPLMLSMKKTDQMKVLMIKCAEELEVPLATLKFMFDGEELEESATPAELDLEGGEALDVIRK